MARQPARHAQSRPRRARACERLPPSVRLQRGDLRELVRDRPAAERDRAAGADERLRRNEGRRRSRIGGHANDGLRVVRLRLFTHTGPGQSANFVLPAFARQIP